MIEPSAGGSARGRETADGDAGVAAGAAPSGGKKLRVSLISPAEVGFEGEADGLVAPAHDGKLGILYGHAPMVVLLGEGELIVRRTWRHDLRFHVVGGFLQVADNEVSVLAEEIRALEPPPPDTGGGARA